MSLDAVLGPVGHVLWGGLLAAMILLLGVEGGRAIWSASDSTRGRILAALGFAAFLAIAAAAPPEEGPYPSWLRRERAVFGWRTFGATFAAFVIGAYLASSRDEAERRRERSFSASESDDDDDE